jgi:MoaA/NifB/PqqE/SkfB family radical SAM enzyme
MSEAAGLGVGTVLIAGGEPLTVPGLFDITKKYPALTYALFTNGTMVDERVAANLAAQRHVIPVLSMEGDACATDSRRGEGMAAKLDGAMALLKRKGLFFGASITVTRENVARILDESYIKGLYDKGCRLFFFVEYVPVEADTEVLTLAQAQRDEINRRTAELREKIGALFIAFPGDEELFGGCLAAGRGFVHINAAGDLEPCPFAPYSDRSLAEGSLKSALRSPLLQKIRENHGKLKETSGGCALWTEREWVESLSKSGE